MTPRQHRRLYAGALVCSAALGATLYGIDAGHLLSAGPANPGHAAVACEDCHAPAPGSMRQQLQANVQHAIGNRSTPAHFMTAPVSTEGCQSCHENEADLHPVYRFEEPRFADAREALGADRCVGCHVEHSAERVSHGLDLCQHCHDDLTLQKDPIEPTHAVLVESERWPTCMGCHDFHGNHARDVPVDFDQRLDAGVVRSYLKRGENPYGPVLVEAKEPTP